MLLEMQIVFMNQKACLIHLYFGAAPFMLSQGHIVSYSAAFVLLRFILISLGFNSNKNIL